MSGRFGNIVLIGRREFYQVAFNPIVVVLLVFSIILVYVNAAFGRFMLDSLSAYMPTSDMFVLGYGQVFGSMMIVFAIVAGFLGVFSISEERSGSLGVLLSKPVFRPDVLLGKMLGIGSFMLVFITIVHLLTGLFLLVYYREPVSTADYVLRLMAFIAANFFESILIMGLGVLAGVVFKNSLVATSAIAIYVYGDFFSGWMSVFPLTVNRLLYGIVVPAEGVVLFRNGVSFITWFGLAVPHIVLVVLIIVAVLLLDCVVFSRQDGVV